MEILGHIPAGWKACRIKNLLKERTARSSDGNETLLMMSQIHGLVVRSEFHAKAEAAASAVGHKLVDEGDLVFNKLKPHLGVFFKSTLANTGCVSGDYAVYKPRHSVDTKIFEYLFRSPQYLREFICRATGVVEGLVRLYTDDLFDIPIAIPPPEELSAILAFLDDKTAKIDEAIAQKERMIKLLQERKQILIQTAVTKGLDPNVPMKDSGIDCIGEIPAHWEFSANASLFRERKEPGLAELPILTVSIHSGVSENELSDEENDKGKVRIQDRTSYSRVYPGDVAFNMMRAWQGGIGCVRVDGMVSPAYIVGAPTSKFESEYFELQYRLPGMIGEMNRWSKGITDFRKRLYWDEFKSIRTLMPPLGEQTAIVSFVHEKSEQIDGSASSLGDQIAHLKELRATLIDSAVTGKIKVT